MQRRDLLMGATAAAAGLLSGGACQGQDRGQPRPLSERICLFTDHLDDSGFSYTEIARMLAPLKIVGPDVTVRGGGVVPPENVADELPKVSAAFRDEGMSIPMLTTNLTSARDPAAQPILTTMAKLGIGYFKLGYYHYHELGNWEAELESSRKDLAGLLELSRKAGLTAGLHNHAGATIGGALWDAWEFLRPLDRGAVGFFFDPAHATLEGAKYAWKLNTKIPFAGPVSVHIEYDPGGNTRVERIDNNLAAAQRDIAFVRDHLAALK